MSEFLMIVPEGWIEIPNPESIISESSWEGFLPSDTTNTLIEYGLLPADDSLMVEDFRVFRDSGILRLWVKIVPHIIG